MKYEAPHFSEERTSRRVRMKVLITGSVNGSGKALRDLVYVSNPDLTLVLGPLNLRSALKLKKQWFFIRGRNDNIKTLLKCDGIDIMSRIFKTKTGITFSGLSGSYHPQAQRLTRSEWIKSKGNLNSRSANYIFSDDIERLTSIFERLNIKGIDILLFPFNPVRNFPALISMLNPNYVFFPSNSYIKRIQNGTKFIGLEPINSEKGRYILRV